MWFYLQNQINASPPSLSPPAAHGWTHSILWCCNAFWRALLGDFVMLEVAHLKFHEAFSLRTQKQSWLSMHREEKKLQWTLHTTEWSNYKKTSTKSCQGYYWLAILLFRVNKWVRESEDRGSHRSQKRMARRQHKYAARSWVHPCKTIFPDTGLNLYFRSSQKPMFASAGMSFEYYKSISLGNYICPGWFYLASAPSHHILLFRNCTAQNAKGDPADVLLDVLWSRERCTRLRGFLPALHSPTTWAGLYQDIQSQF